MAGFLGPSVVHLCDILPEKVNHTKNDDKMEHCGVKGLYASLRVYFNCCNNSRRPRYLKSRDLINN